MSEMVTQDNAAQRLKERGAEYKAAMVTLWAAGLAAFGARWRADYGDVGDMTFKLWGRSLCRSFEPDLIADGGARVLSQWRDKFPPSLGQLREHLLLEARTRNHEKAPALPPAKRSQSVEIRERELDKMFALMGVPRD